MDRRVAGLLLLVVALVAALVVPNIAGKQVRGAALAEVISAPPAVGSCIGAIAPTTSAPGPSNSPNADGAGSARALPVATVVPCRGAVIGEIISVTPTSTSTVSTLGEYDAANPSCRSKVEGYLGTLATTEIRGVQWSKSIYVNAVSVGPDAHDRAAGRTWTACVLSAVNQTYPATTSLKSSWTADTLPSVFGLCWAAAVVQRGTPTACTSPHTTQQLGYGLVASASDSGTSIVSAADPDQVVAGCRQLAATVMKVTDPTRGGALSIKVVSARSGAPYVQCAVAVVGSRKLNGSLIGLGTRALPLA